MAYLENSGGYESMTWINDKEGKEYVCYLNDLTKNVHFEEIPEKISVRCLNVNNLVGTERW